MSAVEGKADLAQSRPEGSESDPKRALVAKSAHPESYVLSRLASNATLLGPSVPNGRIRPSHEVREVRARQSHRGKVLRRVRHAPLRGVHELRRSAFPDRQVLLRVRSSDRADCRIGPDSTPRFAAPEAYTPGTSRRKS